MAAWVHLSTRLLFVFSLLHFRGFNAESAASLKHTYLESLDKKCIFLSKKRKKKTKMEWYQLYLGDTRNLTLLQHHYDVTKLYGRWIDFEESKGLMGNFIWWRKIPENICLDEDVLKKSWRCLSSSSSRDVLINSNIFASVIRFQKTSSRRFNQDQYIRLGHTSSKSLEHVFKTSSGRLAKTSSRHLQDVLKTFWRRFEDVFKTSCKDAFKTSVAYHQVKLFA